MMRRPPRSPRFPYTPLFRSVPKGGPDGGDGGHGGGVVLLCDDSLRDLQSFKRKAHYKAPRGTHGQGANRHGADGEDLVVRVPPDRKSTRLNSSHANISYAAF